MPVLERAGSSDTTASNNLGANPGGQLRSRRAPVATASLMDSRLADSSGEWLSSETPSEEDYDENFRPNARDGFKPHDSSSGRKDNPLPGLDQSQDQEESFQGRPPQQHRKFRDFVFSHQVSTFDAQSDAAMKSPFYGFYTLFWLSVALLMCKIFANNWRVYGNPLGTNDIMRSMFRRDVAVLLLSDGVMCGLTGVSWLLQRLVLAGLVNWDRAGWVIQHIWQACFIAAAVHWTIVRDWPWTHTVFFVLHSLVMLMKQHSYAFYNGHLSTMYHKRQYLLSSLISANSSSSTQTPSLTSPTPPLQPDSVVENGSKPSHPHLMKASVFYDAKSALDILNSNEPLSYEQTRRLERCIRHEIDTLNEDLQGTASDTSRAYPNNLTFKGHYLWIPLPTVVYELEYPRSNKIHWAYVAEKLAAMVGIIFVMVQVSQYYIYPVVLATIEMREANMPLAARFKEFPWLLSDLLFPFMMEYLLTWYLIWETVLNILAELTYFADRHFYDAWWNSGKLPFPAIYLTALVSI